MNDMGMTYNYLQKKMQHNKIDSGLNATAGENEIVSLMRVYLESLFPRGCANCKQQFVSLFDYLSNTKRLGSVISYDLEINNNWRPVKPLGTIIWANCRCGNTIILNLKNMPIPQLWLLLAWVRKESQKRGMDSQILLDYLWDEISGQVLTEPDKGEQLKNVIPHLQYAWDR
jgi:hypothetical protein